MGVETEATRTINIQLPEAVIRGDGLLINVELINAQDNSQIWGQIWRRPSETGKTIRC